MLVLGSSFVIVPVMTGKDSGPSMWTVFPHSVMMGILVGILDIERVRDLLLID